MSDASSEPGRVGVANAVHCRRGRRPESTTATTLAKGSLSVPPLNSYDPVWTRKVRPMSLPPRKIPRTGDTGAAARSLTNMSRFLRSVRPRPPCGGAVLHSCALVARRRDRRMLAAGQGSRFASGPALACSPHAGVLRFSPRDPSTPLPRLPPRLASNAVDLFQRARDGQVLSAPRREFRVPRRGARAGRVDAGMRRVRRRLSSPSTRGGVPARTKAEPGGTGPNPRPRWRPHEPLALP